ncbi:hypothetical protein FRC01_002026 [Tulasnella sp. 417]|nr:hypothetical protein FRC01_002026 [Tulasnella sp. 417]
MPGIWVKLSLRMDERFIDLVLSRSMHSPLTITGSLFSSPALEKLLQHTYRWKVLNVNIAMDGTLDRLALHSVPILEELRLDRPEPTLHMIPFSGSTPMLRIVHIHGRGVQWGISVLSNLHELSLCNIQDGVPNVDILFQTLSNSPQLTRLRIQHTHLTRSPSPQTRIPLLCLRSLELEDLGRGILKQLLESIEIPTSAKCVFSVELDDDGPEWASYEQLEPIGLRMAALTNVSRGTRSTLTLKDTSDEWTQTIGMTYEGWAQQHGALTAEVDALTGTNIDVFEYFASQLGQGEHNPIPPTLHIINPPYRDDFGNDLKLLQRLHKHLPNTEEILIDGPSFEFLQHAFNMLFPMDHSPRLFPRLSTLGIRGWMREWTYWLEARQKRQNQRGGVEPLPLQTLKIEGGIISDERMEALEKLVPNLVLDRVDVK